MAPGTVKRMRRLLVLVLVLASTGAAWAAATDRSVTATAPVEALGASGGQVVYAVKGENGLCGTVSTWDTRTRGVIHYPPGLRLCPATSTGSGIASVQVASGRVL